MSAKDIDARLWELAKDTPELRDALTRDALEDSGLYSIPTRQYRIQHPEDKLPAGEDIHLTACRIEDPAKREAYLEAIKKVDSLTVGQLAQRLSLLSSVYTVREATGEELKPYEKTLKDIDVTLLALFSIWGALDIKKD